MDSKNYSKVLYDHVVHKRFKVGIHVVFAVHNHCLLMIFHTEKVTASLTFIWGFGFVQELWGEGWH
jgi:hypothetical protein